ncbi:hypothetical protein ACFLXA_05465 [Chloroflexota bacterium]
MSTMAGGQPVTAFGYEFRAKPKAFWRRIPMLGDIVPYWQASKHHFILTIKRIEQPSEEQKLNWWILAQNGHNIKGYIVIPPLQIDGEKKFSIGNFPLGFTGDTLLIINGREIDGREPLPYLILYTFHTTSKSWLFLTSAVAIGTALLATLGNWLIN